MDLFKIHFFLILIFVANLALGQEAPVRWLVQWDNDLLAGSDRNYTNGARVAYIRNLDGDQRTHNFLQNSLRRVSGTGEDAFLGDYRYRDGGPSRFSWGMGVTQLMFTPEDSNALTAPDGERPYAGWLGLEFSLHVKNQSSTSSVTLSLGTTGKNSYADDAQNWIHENISNSPLYQGWDSQVPGEMTVNLHFDHKHKLGWLASERNAAFRLDGYMEWGAAIGNFRTDAYLGGLLRGGFNLPDTYTTPRVQIGSYGHRLFIEDPHEPGNWGNFSAFGFIGARGSAVLHDISLDGPVFRDFDTGVDREPLVGELLVGFGFKLYEVDISVSRTFRSDEFEGQDENQQYGSVQVRAPWSAPWRWFR
jgi:hypothetical protein